MYPDKQAGTPTQAMQVVCICIWVDKILRTNMDLMYYNNIFLVFVKMSKYEQHIFDKNKITYTLQISPMTVQVTFAQKIHCAF